jgi:catechol 2,3-dioxygenase
MLRFVVKGALVFVSATGLYHLAILLPSRQALGHWLKHYIISQHKQVAGAGDHLVSEALYLSDPEGNGLEVYRDRPRESWQYNGERIKMDTLAVDLPALVAAAPNKPWQGMPAGTTLGHVHLQVHDVAQPVSFYRDILGFTMTNALPCTTHYSLLVCCSLVLTNVWWTKGTGHVKFLSKNMI